LLIERSPAGAKWQQDESEQPHEAHSLKLDCSKANQLLAWKSRWSLETAVQNIADWQKAFLSGEDMHKISLGQITDYQSTH